MFTTFRNTSGKASHTLGPSPIFDPLAGLCEMILHIAVERSRNIKEFIVNIGMEVLPNLHQNKST